MQDPGARAGKIRERILTYVDPAIYGMSMEVQVRPRAHLGVYKYLLKKFAT
jgi:hypothetical protein